ncbi:hypothetical protein [Mycolicibacterium tokaiense]|jgi:hypothetical protein|uniref:Secreted protein n=1 Tax=Mycolicibacterium tokaiense TaxID=39695 RepID=A0A378TK14_9MYCO|nr:hypothetical protein [Mycolicibacterium tokaiense]BBY84492.1 hypothetical protein MTOK_02740 [Mycolicibacterium tokaiense]STZ61000.1 Uncharacterised protein [Mycolicibacterium tokaiense]
MTRLIGVLFVFAVLLAAPAAAESYAQLPAVPVVASPGCGGTVSADAQVTPMADGNGVRVAISYDAGRYDGSCTLTVAATWTNQTTGASGEGDITAVSVIDGHYGFIGYANTQFATGSGDVVITLSTHPGAELRLTV